MGHQKLVNRVLKRQVAEGGGTMTSNTTYASGGTPTGGSAGDLWLLDDDDVATDNWMLFAHILNVETNAARELAVAQQLGFA